MFTIEMNVDAFFDKKGVEKMLGRSRFLYLKRSGGLLRRRARQSIRTRKRAISKPGSQPYSKVGSKEFGLKSILFQVNKAKKEVVVGAIGGRSKNVAPNIHEFGGTATFRQGKRTVRVRYPRRPFMKPAMKAISGELPRIYAQAYTSQAKKDRPKKRRAA